MANDPRLSAPTVRNLDSQMQQTAAWTQMKPVKHDKYANSITVERREHDAVLRFHCRGEDYSNLVCEITVPLGALEGVFA